MARRRANYSVSACEKWLSQGYGRGEKEHYKPWVRIGDFGSHGVSAAIPGLTVRRIHEVLSGIETRVFLLADFSKDVIDIREQFPLFPHDHLIALAKQVGITYPHLRGEPYTLTTDLLLTRNIKGVISYFAIAVKPTTELLKKSVQDKLELERLWWNSLGVEWALCTEADISEAFADNLTWISQEFRELGYDYVSLDIRTLVPIISNFPPQSYFIEDIIVQAAEALDIDSAAAKILLCKAMWEHALVIDLEISIQKEGIIKILRWEIGNFGQNGSYQYEHIA